MSVFFRVDQWQMLLLFLLLTLCSFAASSLHAAPRIECDAPRHDFGTVVGREQVVHEFVLRNAGDEPLVISKIKNCCGVETKVEPMTIPPGSNAVCTSVFNTKNRYGVQDKQILLITNDKKNLYYDLRMVGTLLKPVEFTPRFIQLGDLLPDGSVSETITATNLLDKPVALESVSTTVKGLEVEIVSGAVGGGQVDDHARPTMNDAGPVRCWTVRVRSMGALEIGRINGQVLLRFSTGTVTVPVIGEVKPILQATPTSLQLSSGATKDVERMVMLRSGDGRAFEILSSTLENAEGGVETRKLADGNWQVKLAIRPDSIKPGASVAIKTSCESQEIIAIPIQTR